MRALQLQSRDEQLPSALVPGRHEVALMRPSQQPRDIAFTARRSWRRTGRTCATARCSRTQCARRRSPRRTSIHAVRSPSPGRCPRTAPTTSTETARPAQTQEHRREHDQHQQLLGAFALLLELERGEFQARVCTSATMLPRVARRAGQAARRTRPDGIGPLRRFDATRATGG